MPLFKLLPSLMAAIVVSIAAMVSGIRAELPLFAWCASGLFAAALIATAIDVNLPWWQRGVERYEPDTPAIAAIRNAQLLALTYAWGSLALLAIYRLTPLRWQHGLQYGAAMALIAWLVLLYVHLLSRPGNRLRSPRALARATWLSLGHGAAALGGLAFMVLSGKLASIKDDWGANQIFLAGGLAVVCLSIVSAITQLRLAQSCSRGAAKEP